jgi:intracellular septation protein A
MERISRSFDIMILSYRVLLRDKELLVLPLVSMTVTAVTIASFVFGLGVTRSELRTGGPAMYLPLLLLYVVIYTVGIFSQAAVVAGATERMRGGDPTLGSALAAAGRRIGPIIGWAILAATVGTVIRAIQDRAGVFGKLVAFVGGTAWSLAAFFIVPVLVFEDLSIRESLRRSARLFKDVWGESVAGGVTLGLANLVVTIPLAVVALLIAVVVGKTAGIGVFIAGMIALTIVFAALQGIYLATLYRYATEGWVPAGFDGELLRQAYVSKDGANHVTLNLNQR